MDIQDGWEKALRETNIIRERAKELATFEDTHLPYIFLSPSEINLGDTVVRKGEVLVQKPAIILPSNLPQFEGFDFDEEFFSHDTLTNFLLVRGVSFPSMKYNNKTYSLDIFEGHIEKAVTHFSDRLARREDVHTGMVVGTEDVWQFSMLIFICTQIAKSANSDIRKILERFNRRNKA